MLAASGSLIVFRTAVVFALAAACVCLPAPADAAPGVRMSASLHPERLARGTTIALDLQITGAGGHPPPALTAADILFPNELGIALSGLGLETCTATTLETLGPAGCPPDSIMGYGQALGEIPFGPEVIHENASVTVLRAEDENGHIALLLDAEGISPVEAHVVFPSVLLPAHRPYGGYIHMDIPLVPSLPEASGVAVGALNVTLGPDHDLTYYEKRRGEAVSYVPKRDRAPEELPSRRLPLRSAVGVCGR